MNDIEAKEELKKRYIYLYKNIIYLLAPYVFKIDINERRKEYLEAKKMLENFPENKEKKEFLAQVFNRTITLKLDELDEILYNIEEFLFTDELMETTKLYKTLEENKNNKEYLEMINEKLLLASIGKINFSIFTILEKIGVFLDNQSNDILNRIRKLNILDEYFRLYRYENNGKILHSGRILLAEEGNLSYNKKIVKPKRRKADVGVRKNDFILAIDSLPKHYINSSIFTEEEKQQVYLEAHKDNNMDLKTK